jgi:hypothetical protein
MKMNSRRRKSPTKTMSTVSFPGSFPGCNPPKPGEPLDDEDEFEEEEEWDEEEEEEEIDDEDYEDDDCEWIGNEFD